MWIFIFLHQPKECAFPSCMDIADVLRYSMPGYFSQSQISVLWSSQLRHEPPAAHQHIPNGVLGTHTLAARAIGESSESSVTITCERGNGNGEDTDLLLLSVLFLIKTQMIYYCEMGGIVKFHIVYSLFVLGNRFVCTVWKYIFSIFFILMRWFSLNMYVIWGNTNIF